MVFYSPIIRIPILLAAVIMPLLCARGAPAVTLEVAAESRYVFRGRQISQTIVQPGVDVYQDGFYGGFTGFFEISGPYDEVNLYAGTYQSLHPLVSLDAGIIGYFLEDEDRQEGYLGTILEYQFRPAIYVYYDPDHDRFTAEAAIGSRHELNRDNSLDWRIAAGTTHGGGAADRSWVYFRGSVEWVHALTSDLDLALGARVATRDRDLGLPDRAYLWGGLSLTQKF